MQRGDVVLVTGTSTGIGADMALRLVKDGYVVFAAMRGPVSRKEALPLREAGCEVVALDVTSQESCSACVKLVLQKAGRIDALINNAGVGASKQSVEDCNFEDFTNTLETNYYGLVRMTQLVLPDMRTRKKGSIMNITSNAAIAWGPGMAAYNASKAAVEAFAFTLHQEVFRFGIRVCTVRPGVVKTPILEKEKHETSPSSPYFEQIEQAKRMGFGEPPGPEIVTSAISGILAMQGDWEPAYPVTQESEMIGKIHLAKGASWLINFGKTQRTDEELGKAQMEVMAGVMSS